MGGILIWGSILLTIIFSRILSYFGLVDHSLLQRGQVYLPLFTLIAFAALGGVDDYLNIIGSGKKRGLDWLPKIITLLTISIVGAFWFYFKLDYNQIHIPYVGDMTVGIWYIPIFIFIIIGTANAVNVTDGLDGLAGGLLVIAFGAFSLLAYLSGLAVLAAFCAACSGAVAAFLWHNVPPALFFMGDTGSLALGGTLGVIAMMTDNVLVLPFIGFIFVIEMLSVIIQLTSKKFRGGKKVFKAAPIHHHFEALEWGESKVTMRFWIIGGFVAFLGLVIGLFG
jgi:phospho-N-acetylmuramoyl-pentapeptide-transferase